MSSTRSGFTLIEMLVIVPIVILAIGAFLLAIISLTGEVLASRAKNVLAYNVQDALTRIERDIQTSASFLATNSVTLTTPQGYNNDTTNFENVDSLKGDMLILEQNAAVSNPLSGSPNLVYLKDQPYPCGDPQIRNNSPLKTNIIYYVKGSTLWRRTILQADYASSAVSCSTPWQQPSCQPGYTNSFCKTNDVELVTGITETSFLIDYFDSPGATTANAVVSDPSTPTGTRTELLSSIQTARISIIATNVTAGRDISWSATVQITRSR